MVSSIKIENRCIAKPFLGGWRHKVTGTEYLNAASQTGPSTKTIPWRVCSRAVQSVGVKDETTQPLCHRATQMCRNDYYVSHVSDKYISCKPYETYEQMELRLDFDGNARTIQRNYRAYRLLKFVRQCAQRYREMIENCKRHEEERINMQKKRHQQEILCMIHPRTRTDFDMLYELIEKWRADRFKDIKLRLFKAGQRAENYFILEKTVEMLNVIERHRRAIKDRREDKRRVRFLTVNCEPIRWYGYKGRSIEMITMKTQKAREYKAMYDFLRNNNDIVERIETLIMLKKSVEEDLSVAAFEFLYLLDQEVMILSCGIKSLPLDYLRKRLLNAYLNFIHHRESEKDESWKYPRQEKRAWLRQELKQKLCNSCRKLLPYHKFSVHNRMKKLSNCTDCTWLLQRNVAPVNYDPYVVLLNCVQADERRRNCFSGLSFVMQPPDIYHLVNTIWHGRSIISKNDDLSLLRLIRYNSDGEWSPWNCILLTEEEAEIHCRIKDIRGVYSRHLLHRIYLAHQIARNHFKRLNIYEKSHRESSRGITRFRTESSTKRPV